MHHPQFTCNNRHNSFKTFVAIYIIGVVSMNETLSNGRQPTIHNQYSYK